MYNLSPQNTSNTSPPQDKPTQRLTHDTTAKPDIPPSALAKDLLRAGLPVKLHAHSLGLLIHLHDTFDLTAVATGEEEARTCAPGAVNQNSME